MTSMRVTNDVDPTSYNNTELDKQYKTKKFLEYTLAYWDANTCYFDGFLMIFLIYRNTFLFDTLYYNDNPQIRNHMRGIVDKMDKGVDFNIKELNKTDSCLVPSTFYDIGDFQGNDSVEWLKKFLKNIFLSEEQRDLIAIADEKAPKVTEAINKERDARKAAEAAKGADAAAAAKKALDDLKAIEEARRLDMQRVDKALIIRREFLQQESSTTTNECKQYEFTIDISVEHENPSGKIDKISDIYNTTDPTIKKSPDCLQFKIRNYNFPIIFNASVGGSDKKQVIPDEALIINNFIYELIGINTKLSMAHYIYFIKDPDSLNWYHYNDIEYRKKGLTKIDNYNLLIQDSYIAQNTLADPTADFHLNGNSYTFIYYPNKAMVEHHKHLNLVEDQFKQQIMSQKIPPPVAIDFRTYLTLCYDIGIANANIIKQIHASIPEINPPTFDETKFQDKFQEFTKIFKTNNYKDVQETINMYGKKPEFFYTTEKWVLHNEKGSRLLRQCVLQETLCAFASTFYTMTYHEIAHYNMIRFKENSEWQLILNEPTILGHIKVIASDFLDTALKATKIFGETFTILNMANATGFGGGYTHGMSAQEENMFRRTDCHFSMLRTYLSKTDTDKYRHGYFYDDGLNMEARITRGLVFDDRPRVCIRRGESIVEKGEKTLEDIKKYIDYKWLDYYDIFEFYEMRNAAPDLRNKTINPFYKYNTEKDANTTKKPVDDAVAEALYNTATTNPAFEKATLESLIEEAKSTEAIAANAKFKNTQAIADAEAAATKVIIKTMEERIRTQLTELIKKKCKYVILSAFGCGAFHNHPVVVSKLYEEIFKEEYDSKDKITYRGHFKVIIFAIYKNNPNIDNSEQFKKLDNSKVSDPMVKKFLNQLDDSPAAAAA